MITIFKHWALKMFIYTEKGACHLKEILREKLCTSFINVAYI